MTAAHEPEKIDVSKPGVYREQLNLAHIVAQFILGMPLAEMVEAINLAESTAPVFAPTLWIEKSKAMEEDKEIITALRDAQRKIERARELAGR